MIRICILLLGQLAFTSCGNKAPSGILKPDKMQAVLWDVIKADVFTTQIIKLDTAKNAVEENIKLQQQIFAIHHISKDDFYRSYDYYKTHTPVLRVILDSMIVQAGRGRDYGTKSLQAQ